MPAFKNGSIFGAGLAEQLDCQCAFDRTIRHPGEGVGDVEQNGLIRPQGAAGVPDANTKLGEDVTGIADFLGGICGLAAETDHLNACVVDGIGCCRRAFGGLADGLVQAAHASLKLFLRQVGEIGRMSEPAISVNLQTGFLCGLAGLVGSVGAALGKAEHRRAGGCACRSEAGTDQGQVLSERRKVRSRLRQAGGELGEIHLGDRGRDVAEGLFASIAHILELLFDRLAAVQRDALQNWFLSHGMVSPPGLGV
ncbi:hypothetical protein C1D09_018800 [Mesorhizobium intechi]|uniref:Uncharacterized protein n=1 Tax=Mesorhizobium intechi TaxID=537601 RepID=A0A8T9AMW8_9HYPH|nr:hypothetical protein C1D09_018800 [Mesorhizobium intechi]